MTSFECIFLVVVLGRFEAEAADSRGRNDAAAATGTIIEARSEDSRGLRKAEENSLAAVRHVRSESLRWE